MLDMLAVREPGSETDSRRGVEGPSGTKVAVGVAGGSSSLGKDSTDFIRLR